MELSVLLGIFQTVRLIDLSGSTPLEVGLAEVLRHLVEIFSTEDARLGLSTIGKRAPVFAGR